MSSDEGDDKGNIIEFPGSKPKETKSAPKGDHQKVTLTKDKVFRLVKAISTIHMATTYKARKNELCKENIRKADFPCKLNCACYVNICAAMGLEAFFGGETQKEAEILVDSEYEMMRIIYQDLYDEDE